MSSEETEMTVNKKADQIDQEIQKDQSFINTQQQKLTDLIAQVIAAAMIVQQVSNTERASNNENSTAEGFSNSTNFTDLTMSVILLQSTH